MENTLWPDCPRGKNRKERLTKPSTLLFITTEGSILKCAFSVLGFQIQNKRNFLPVWLRQRDFLY
jgi:hypothetical protein